MHKPVLVIMAAGMGSRYGGLKQIDPIDEQGHVILDFSIYDALAAGFEEVIFIIKKENEEDFRAAIGDRISRHATVKYVHQQLDDIPEGFQVPESRVKPWGTGHAILSAIYTVNDAPFAVINADDYYGKEAFQLVFDYLSDHRDDEKYRYAMVGYELQNTVTEHGSVARGVCRLHENGFLAEINERTRIEKREDGIAYSEDGGETWVALPGDTPVSMNLWGFQPSVLDELQSRFAAFLEKNLPVNPEKCEYFLPFVVDEIMQEGKATVQVLRTKEQWYGVTYREDKPHLMEAVKVWKAEGRYPEHLWS